MLTVSVSFNSKKAGAGIQQGIDQAVRLIATDVFKTIKRLTPVRSGRARRGWKFKKKSNAHYNVRNDVPYINRLDGGSSQQARKGMTRPALSEVLSRNRSRRIK